MVASCMESLLLKPSIKRASTILVYKTYVKRNYRKGGCHPYVYNTAFLKQVRKGLRKTLPSPRDFCFAFILPKYLHALIFQFTSTEASCFLHFATIIDFFWNAQTPYIFQAPAKLFHSGCE